MDVNDDQANSDGDSHGDVCDNCVDHANKDQSDVDADPVGDVCDNCVSTFNPQQIQEDEDSFGSACDNCPTITNEDQATWTVTSLVTCATRASTTRSTTRTVAPCSANGDMGPARESDNCCEVYNPHQFDAHEPAVMFLHRWSAQ